MVSATVPVHLATRTVEVRRSPLADGYAEMATFEDGQPVSPLAEGAPPVNVSALLG